MIMFMASSSAQLSYKRLNEEMLVDEEGDMTRSRERVTSRSRVRRVRVGVGVGVARKVRVKIFRRRCKNFLGEKQASLVKIVWTKICERFKETNSRFGDIFSGNYVFMHITPTPTPI